MSKTVTKEELDAHNTKQSLYILLDGKVYDVTKFLDEHPGGDEVLIHEAGQDATDAFEDVGHSDEARALLPDMLVGAYSDGTPKTGAGAGQSPNRVSSAVEQGSNLMYIAPLALAGAYFAWRYISSA